MAVYKLGNKKKEENPNTKKIVGFSLIGISSFAFLFLTNIVPAIYTFLLGVFGVFAYPLFLLLFIVGLALVNNRKYVKGKKYLITMLLTVFFALCIFQLIIVGDKGDFSFFEYIGKNYLVKWSAGGIICGIVNAIFLYITNLAGTYIILILAFLLSLALFLDSLNLFRRRPIAHEEKTVSVKLQENVKPTSLVKTDVEKQEVNVVLNGNLKEEEKKELSAREKLGLDKKRDRAYEFYPKEEIKKEVKHPEPKSLRELILTPPEIDYKEYFKNLDTQQKPERKEVQENFQQLKIEETVQFPNAENIQYVDNSAYQPYQDNMENVEKVADNKDDEFKNVDNPFIKNDEAIISQADDILKSAVLEEKAENPDIYEGAQESVDNSRGFDRSDRDFNRGEFNRDRGLSRDNEFAPEFPERETQRDRLLSDEKEPQEKEEEPYIYEKPPIDFITTKSVDLSTLNEEVATKRVLLENTLENFGVPAKVQGVVVGPAVTRYELEMPQGVSVSKIKNRADDIALSLAAEGSIRIEAPVPGKSVVGVEVPNASIATVSLKDVLVSKEFNNNPSPLTFALGKDITGNIITCDMQKLTHLLVAGSTGSGKSVCLNSIILSMIYKSSPQDVKIILIDPKRVEFSSYEALPHLIMPKIVCDTQKAVNTLAWAVGEMERRFELLGLARVKNINEYNQTQDVLEGKVKKMPFIVMIVDELADLMMTGKKEVEEKIIRLAQKSRAAGIHLILATQRPSVDVITGLIKANFPSRIAFAVTSAVDSMTILDRVGAEKLLGKGDMLYYPVGAQEPKRVQACFITTNETNRIVDYVRENNKPIFDKEIEEQINNPNKNNNNASAMVNNEIDELLPLALKAAIDCGQASATMIRRKFAIGYPRAARIIDQMEAAGYISTADGVKGRTVYTTEEEFHELFGDQYD